MLFQTTFTIQIKLINKISMYIIWRFLRVSSWCASPACLIYRLLWFTDINSDKTRIQFGFLISHIEPCARIAHSALQFSAQLHSRTISRYFCSYYQMRIQYKRFHGGTVRASNWLSKGWWFEPQRRIFSLQTSGLPSPASCC